MAVLLGTSVPSLARVKRQTCTNHCSACGAHFHSLGAFDAHRIGDFAVSAGPERRRCAAVQDFESLKDGLQAWTTDGHCELVWPHVSGITIWQRARDAERASEAVGLAPTAGDAIQRPDNGTPTADEDFPPPSKDGKKGKGDSDDDLDGGDDDGDGPD